MKKSLFDNACSDDGAAQQWCIFCNRHDADMPVYSAGVGRIGICKTCAQEAVRALKCQSAAQVLPPVKKKTDERQLELFA